MLYKNTLDKLEDWIDREGISGWDNYDGLNSSYFDHLHNHKLRFLISQFNLYSPINLRPQFKVEKGIDIKGLGLFSYAAILNYKRTQQIKYLDLYVDYNSYLFSKSLKSVEGYHSWGSHYYPYESIHGSTTHKTADIIATSRILIELVDGYLLTKDEQIYDIITDVVNYFFDKLYVESSAGIYFKYYSSKNNGNITYNASAHALEALSHYLKINKSKQIIEMLDPVADLLVQSQLENGSWNHSYNPSTSKSRKQLDFHIGYDIDGLLAYLPYSRNKSRLFASIIAGAEYYKQTLFNNSGMSYFRYPHRFPVDIHNQAQGIITFSKLSSIDEMYALFAKKILDWTIEHMFDDRGYFYYQIWPLLTNKIPYMRWSEAWMMVALSVYLNQRGID